MVGLGIIVVCFRKDGHKTEGEWRANVRNVAGERSLLSLKAMVSSSGLCPVINKKPLEF